MASNTGRNAPIPAALYLAVLTRDDFVCQYCTRATKRPTVDHVRPRDWFPAYGPPSRVNAPENLVCACRRCNRTKSVLSLHCYAERQLARGVDSEKVSAMVKRVTAATKRPLPKV